MNEEHHHPKLSPSRFPAFERCIHYEPIQLDSESRRRGLLIHAYAARMLMNEPIGSVPMEEVDAAGRGEWIAKEIRKILEP
jgi:hypothetical protein